MSIEDATARELRQVPVPSSGTWVNHREFVALYDTYAEFVWANARRLGVLDEALEDVVQDVFLIAHRRLSTDIPVDALRSWMFSILIRVVRAYRRTRRRKDPRCRSSSAPVDPEDLPDPNPVTPLTSMERSDAVRLLEVALDMLEDGKREVFVLSELEELTESAIAEVLEEKPNTVHSRIRAARKDFNRALARLRCRDEWRLR